MGRASLAVVLLAAATLGCGAFADDCEQCTCETTADCDVNEVCADGICIDNHDPKPGAGEVVCEVRASAPADLMDTCFARIQSGQLADNLRGFTPRFPIYKNDTRQRRWIYIPPGRQVDGSDVDRWQFPVGTILWQELSTEGASRIETRMLEKVGNGIGADQWRPTVYLWTQDDSDAHRSVDGLSPRAEDDYVIDTLADYPTPDPSSCMGCHGSSSDAVLGFTAVQLTGESSPTPHEEWVERGYLGNAGAPAELVGGIVDQRMLGYLHSNCGTCHSEGGSQASLGMLMNYSVANSTDFASTNFYQTAVYRNLRVTPGNLEASKVYASFIDGSMPPASVTSRIDPEYSQYVPSWIHTLETGSSLPASAPVIINADDPNGALLLGYDQTTTDPSEGEVFVRAEGLPIRSRAFIPIDTAKTYTISGRFRSSGATNSVVSLGLAPYDASGNLIESRQSNRTGSPATIDLAATTSTSIATTSAVDSWNQPPAQAWHRFVGIYYDGITSKLPDFVLVGPGDASTAPSAGAYSSAVGNVVTLNTALPQSVLDSLTSNTVVMNHLSAEAFLWTAAWNTSAGTGWTDFSGTISGESFNGGTSVFRPGTVFAKLQLIANDNQYGVDATLLFDELRVDVAP